ncbi:sugar transporter [Thozetella sp. PMI_491]|nr:sugar transporter [Thozetella sp. PMI_491]
MAPTTTSQSAVGRHGAEKSKGIVGMLKNPYVFMTCSFAALGCLMYGYDQGVMSSVLVMENFQAQFPDLMGSTIQGWLVAALELGAWAGALFTGFLADAISRKYSMMTAVVIFTLGTALQAGARSAAMLFAGRVIGGWGIGMFSTVVPLYQAELAPPELRGSLVSLQQLSITIGTAIAFWLDYGMHFVGGTACNPEGIPADQQYYDGTFNYTLAAGHRCLGESEVSWRFPLALQILPAWILFVGMFFLPFSPRWLMMKHREEDCLDALCRVRRLDREDPVLRAEFLEIKAAVMFDEETAAEHREKNGRFGAWKLLLAPNVFKRVMIGCWIMIFQQFTGINAVLYYAPQIFATFGFTSVTTNLMATGVTGILQIIFTLPAVLFLDNLGRKTFLIMGSAGMMICHIIVAALNGTYEDSWSDHGSAGWACIAFIWIFAINFAYSWGPVAWLIPQEIFPNSMRSRGVALVASTNWIFNFVIGLTTKDMLATMRYGTYIFFACFCFMGGAFVYFFVPETKDKTLEEMDLYFGGDKSGIAAEDRERMQRIEAALGLQGVERPEDLKTTRPVLDHAEDVGGSSSSDAEKRA